MFKKIFGGKAIKKTKGGSDVYTYNENQVKQAKMTVADSMYVDEIVDHFDKNFTKTTNTFHEIFSNQVHIDINFIEPTDEEPYKVVYTTGMSDLPMTLPSEIEEEYAHLKRAELMIFLPESWPTDSEAFKEEKYYWPIRLMKQLARFPHQYNTYLGYGHTIPNSADYIPYAENTELNGVVLSLLKKDVSMLKTKDGTQINIYILIPLYKEEMDYKLKNGVEALLNKLCKLEAGGFIIDPSRKNTCKK